MNTNKISIDIEIKNTDSTKEFILEPYGYSFYPSMGDTIELTLMADGQRLSISIEDDKVIFGCYEPLLVVNGEVELDMSLE